MSKPLRSMMKFDSHGNCRIAINTLKERIKHLEDALRNIIAFESAGYVTSAYERGQRNGMNRCVEIAKEALNEKAK